MEQRFGLFPAFLAHDVFNRHPMLELRRFDDIEQGHAAASALGPEAREPERLVVLFGSVDNDQEDAFGLTAAGRCGVRIPEAVIAERHGLRPF